MQQQNISIGALVSMYKRNELRLPEIQRQYVWRAPKVRDLLDSLYRKYPTGSILLWESDAKIPVRNAAIEQEESAFSGQKLLLDGQQRLTSLTAVLKGERVAIKGKKRPVDIAFNLDHPEAMISTSSETELDELEDESEEINSEDSQYDESDFSNKSIPLQSRTFTVATKSILALPNWVSVSLIFSGVSDGEVMVRAGVSDFSDPRYSKYSARLKRLRSIEDYIYAVHVLEREMTYEEVTEIFVRVNSQGAKLRSSDLALAQMTSRWPELLSHLEEFQKECEQTWSPIEIGQLARGIIVFASRQSKFGAVRTMSLDEMRVGWDRAKAGLRFAINFLKANAGIEKISLLSSPMFLHVIAAFSQTREVIFDKNEVNQLLQWVLIANARGRFGRGASEGLLNEDLDAVFGRKGVSGLLDSLRRQFGRLKIEPIDLSGRGTTSPFFSLAYLALKDAGAKDWYTGLALSLGHQGRTHFIQWHHIFPKALLRSAGFDSAEINEVANMAFIGGQTNQKIGKRPSAEYLEEIATKQGEVALVSQCIPVDRNLWDIGNYKYFLNTRRELLASRLNQFIFDKTELYSE